MVNHIKRIKERVKKRHAAKESKLSLRLIVIVCAVPALFTILFYALRSNSALMGWISVNISIPIWGFIGRINSIFPFSIMEFLVSGAIIWVIYYIIKTVKLTAGQNAKLKILGRRLLIFLTVALYIWSIQIWLWNSGYFAPGFVERNGFAGEGVTVAELTAVTWHFADGANEFAPLVSRDEHGFVSLERRELFEQSTDIFQNISIEFPCLYGRLLPPKPMMFSWLMSRTGYAGIFFAITGEANININMPIFLMPTTIAHEHAHQRGVFAEDEANFVAVLASITSDIAAFQYAGYLFGLMNLMRPLRTANPEAWQEIHASLSEYVLRDWQANFDFWQSQRTFDVGIEVVDRALTAAGRVVRETVDTIYDSFLRANRQELGLQSYGAVVDLLVEYFARWQKQYLVYGGGR